MIRESAIREVKQASPLLPEVEVHVKLRKSGAASWTGLCPFHRENTSSFTVHDRRDPQRPDYYKCFGCGASGDVISFVAAIEGLSRGKAIRALADRAGIDLAGRKESRPAARYMRDLRAQEDFWWVRRRAELAYNLQEACGEYFAAAERGESLQETGEWADCCGRLLRQMDALPPEERRRIFMAAAADADLKEFRRVAGQRAPWDEYCEYCQTVANAVMERNISIAEAYGGMDPADYVVRFGEAAFRRLVDNAVFVGGYQ